MCSLAAFQSCALPENIEISIVEDIVIAFQMKKGFGHCSNGHESF